MSFLQTAGKTALPSLGVLVVGISLPYWLIQQEYVLVVAIAAIIWAVAGQGWNVIGGYGGLLSFGHSVFFGIGAYSTAMLNVHFGISPWVGMIVGAAVAAAAGAILTFPALRLKGVYFTLATFVLALLFADLTTHNREFTGGDQGISIPFLRNSPGMFQFDSRLTLFFVLVVFLAAATLVVSLVARSRLGLFLRASRDDPDAARAAGVNVTRTRLFGLMISAAITSVAGSLMLQYLRFIDPLTAFGAGTAFMIGLVALTGGRGTVLGPVIGAAVLIPVQQILSSTFASGPAGLSGMVYAAIVVAVMLIEPRGLIHLFKRLGFWIWQLIRPPRGNRPPTSPEEITANKNDDPVGSRS
ncbi:High-affinity branched-chain amino acid transport system permease protein LivH [Arthrobacter ulcerisalmonis]|uniref:High-affinity branched-chain amino acid transport system permease protein LivH n=1 Tax=Arthrobacter ulcerisalmonis TaxID=2483813 RepID=A0A3P5W5G7_9MICC|nr:branched-chain amino acid ABC transporter permease [Arthrobacter ulcerisalmonis]VDC18539.1 High-affinity branched-chain amino acid transport system permease protein LivH [Arthrobacter ulcerisalmonis]